MSVRHTDETGLSMGRLCYPRGTGTHDGGPSRPSVRASGWLAVLTRLCRLHRARRRKPIRGVPLEAYYAECPWSLLLTEPPWCQTANRTSHAPLTIEQASMLLSNSYT